MRIKLVNPLTPNDNYSGRTAPLTYKHCILYIYSTNTGTEYFKHGIHSPFFSLQNAVCFVNLTYFVPVLFTFYIQGVLKLKKYNSDAKRLIAEINVLRCTVRKTSKNRVIQFDQGGDGNIIVRDNDNKMVIILKYTTLRYKYITGNIKTKVLSVIIGATGAV